MKYIGGHTIITKDEAEEALKRNRSRLEESAGDTTALVNIAGCLNVMERDTEAMEYAERAIKSLTWTQSVTALNYAQMLRQHGRHEEAWPWISASYHLYPTQMNGHIYGEELVRQGKWLEAWPILSKCRMSKKHIAPKGVPEWMGEDIGGKQLMVIAEGGRGDAFWLFRFLPKLQEMGIHVNYACWQDVWEFLRDHPWLNDPAKSVFTEARMPDCWVSIFELLQWLKVDKPYWPGPYLKGLAWRQYIPSDKPKVGLCWECGERDDVRKFRSLKDHQAAQLLSNDSVTWVSLQKGYKVPRPCWEPRIESWHDTTAIINGLDLVITVDTSVVHLAGAMGKPTWLVLGGYQDCKWGTEGVSGWYPSVRIFRNSTVGFSDVLTQVQNSLDTISKSVQYSSMT